MDLNGLRLYESLPVLRPTVGYLPASSDSSDERESEHRRRQGGQADCRSGDLHGLNMIGLASAGVGNFPSVPTALSPEVVSVEEGESDTKARVRLESPLESDTERDEYTAQQWQWKEPSDVRQNVQDRGSERDARDEKSLSALTSADITVARLVAAHNLCWLLSVFEGSSGRPHSHPQRATFGTTSIGMCSPSRIVRRQSPISGGESRTQSKEIG